MRKEKLSKSELTTREELQSLVSFGLNKQQLEELKQIGDIELIMKALVELLEFNRTMRRIHCGGHL